MALREDIEKQGSFIFRWRSYLPLLAAPLFALALKDSKIIQKTFGVSAQNIWEVFCVLISFLGLYVRCMVASFVPRGTSGRNTKEQVAETLNTTGMYSIVRNPLYLGNFIIFVGVLLFLESWWLFLIGTFGFLLYYERVIFTEEEFLRRKFGDTFLKWAEKTPMFIPNFKNWKAPELSFSLKTMLRREYSSFFSIVATFTFIGIFSDIAYAGRFYIGKKRLIFFICGLAIYFTLMFLKKKTKKLDVQGR